MPIATVADFYPGTLGKRLFGVTVQPSAIAATQGVDDEMDSQTAAPAFSLLSIVAILILVRVLWELAK
ncbi:MAG: hypothetical protein MN733_17670 [Nitrososphaera sp.]|nr:hypothetical protein [Nitrososphaera sp.]MCI0560318.1 hypothetical protein [Nitrososphaera sp.]